MRLLWATNGPGHNAFDNGMASLQLLWNMPAHSATMVETLLPCIINTADGALIGVLPVATNPVTLGIPICLQ